MSYFTLVFGNFIVVYFTIYVIFNKSKGTTSQHFAHLGEYWEGRCLCPVPHLTCYCCADWHSRIKFDFSTVVEQCSRKFIFAKGIDIGQTS